MIDRPKMYSELWSTKSLQYRKTVKNTEKSALNLSAVVIKNI